MLPGVRAVLSFFDGYQKDNGSLGSLPWWRYFDWVPGWQSGNAPQEPDGSSALFDLLLLMAYRWAGGAGDRARPPSPWRRCIASASGSFAAPSETVLGRRTKKLYADTPGRKQFSQHANTLAVLAGVIGGQPARDLMQRALIDAGACASPGCSSSSTYIRRWPKVGEGDRYLDQLGDWRTMLARGLTTFAENVDRPGGSSRSDCHAWSASPEYRAHAHRSWAWIRRPRVSAKLRYARTWVS